LNKKFKKTKWFGFARASTQIKKENTMFNFKTDISNQSIL